MKYSWLTFDPKIWYKANMNSNLGKLERGEGVFIKVNTELPGRGGSFWILGAHRRAMHVSEEMLGEYVTLKIQGNKAIPTTIDETKRLNAIFKPVLEGFTEQQERSRRIAQRLKIKPQEKRPNALKKKEGQGELF